MKIDDYFVTKVPQNPLLKEIVENYFYIDIPTALLSNQEEFIIPFPRITFGYFFDYPFTVTNHTLNTSELVNMVISRISTQKITVLPATNRVRILGAHVKPFGLAHFTEKAINTLPWLINTEELFGSTAKRFTQKVNSCTDTEQMFSEVENVFLDCILSRKLPLITKAIELIEINYGHIEITELSRQLKVSDRTLRNHFHAYIGCSPKEYFRIVKLKQVAYQLKYSENSLTDMAYDHQYFDQAHFIHEVKGITGQSPKQLRKEIPNFRFLQF